MSAELINEKYSEVVDPLGCRNFIDDATDRVSPFIRWNSEGRKFRNTTYEKPLNELMNQIDQKTREVKEAIRDLPEYMVAHQVDTEMLEDDEKELLLEMLNETLASHLQELEDLKHDCKDVWYGNLTASRSIDPIPSQVTISNPLPKSLAEKIFIGIVLAVIGIPALVTLFIIIFIFIKSLFS